MQLDGFGERVEQLRCARMQLECSADGPLRVVAVGDRCAEHRQHAVARMVDDAPAECSDGLVGQGVETIQQGLHVLCVHTGTQRRVAGDVRHQNGGLAALAGQRGNGLSRRGGRSAVGCCGGLRRLSTLRAEPGSFRQGAPATAARARQRSGALLAELSGRAVVVTTTRTSHRLSSRILNAGGHGETAVFRYRQ